MDLSYFPTTRTGLSDQSGFYSIIKVLYYVIILALLYNFVKRFYKTRYKFITEFFRDFFVFLSTCLYFKVLSKGFSFLVFHFLY